MTDSPIYLDYNATTPIDPRVVEAMLPFLHAHFGNPSSDHVYGRRAKAAVANARGEVAALIGARPDEIVFTIDPARFIRESARAEPVEAQPFDGTQGERDSWLIRAGSMSCATEANNLAILGVARALQGGSRRQLCYSAVEHPAVEQPMRHLAEAGWQVETIVVDASGRVDAANIVLGADVALVSVMLANNEVGTLQPVAEIAARAHAAGALMHVDAAQAVGKIPVDIESLGCDLLTLAGHKFYAPKGVGALYVRAGTPLQAIQYGAGHEGSLRPGTENVPHIVALGEAARLARSELAAEAARIRTLRDDLHSRLAHAIPGLSLNGHASERLPNTLNISFPAVAGWQLLAAAPGLAASTGSACHAGQHQASGVLGAMGLSGERAAGAVRLSLGRFSTASEIEQAATALISAWQQLSA